MVDNYDRVDMELEPEHQSGRLPWRSLAADRSLQREELLRQQPIESMGDRRVQTAIGAGSVTDFGEDRESSAFWRSSEGAQTKTSSVNISDHGFAGWSYYGADMVLLSRDREDRAARREEPVKLVRGSPVVKTEEESDFRGRTTETRTKMSSSYPLEMREETSPSKNTTTGLMPFGSGRQNRVNRDHTGGDSARNKAIKRRKPLVTPQPFDGLTSVMNYKLHFETWSEINGLDGEEMALNLASSLKGEAQRVLSNVDAEDRRDYAKLLAAVKNRFLPPSQTQLYRAELRSRKRRPKESFPELGQAIRRKVSLAYPSASLKVQDILARDSFVMRYRKTLTWYGKFNSLDPTI